MRPSAFSVTRPMPWPPYGVGSSLPSALRATARTRRQVPTTDVMAVSFSKLGKDPFEHRGRAFVEPHGSAHSAAPGVGVACRVPFLGIGHAGVFEFVNCEVFRLALDRCEAAGGGSAL